MEERIKYLLEKYQAANTSEAEEKELRAYFDASDAPTEWASYKAQFQLFSRWKTENETIGFDPFTKIEPEKGRIVIFSIPARQLRWICQVAASVALLLIGYGAGFYTNKDNGDKQQLAELSSEVMEMKKILLSGDMPTGSSASVRLQAVSQSTTIENADSEIIELLINTMDRDPNVNVRLAAAEALLKFGNVPRVRSAMVNSLKLQKDPVLQIALIDMLVALKEKSAVAEMQNLAQDKNALKIVKQKAQAGIGVLL